MTTVADANVHAIALDGTFDDAQAMVKALFNDAAFRKSAGLTAVNSINWARVMAQIVYYVTASLSLGGPDRAPAFCVPTGNRSEEHTSELQSLMRISYAVFCLKKKTTNPPT